MFYPSALGSSILYQCVDEDSSEEEGTLGQLTSSPIIKLPVKAIKDNTIIITTTDYFINSVRLSVIF
jgi:hypothetical protein